MCYLIPPCRSRLIFTCRMPMAQGLVLPDKQLAVCKLSCLDTAAATQVLCMGDVQLSPDQLQKALSYCAGLPLALTLINSALRTRLTKHQESRLFSRLSTRGPILDHGPDQLADNLKPHILWLSPELRDVWLDLATVVELGSASWLHLCCLFDRQAMLDLEQLNLLKIVWLKQGRVCNIIIHDVLLMVAERMTRLNEQECRLTGRMTADRLGQSVFDIGYQVRRLRLMLFMVHAVAEHVSCDCTGGRSFQLSHGVVLQSHG